MIDSKRVKAIFLDCLFKENELINGQPTSEPVCVYGITNNIGFHKERLQSYKDEIKEMLNELPLQFQSEKNGGEGGWSFLNMCVTKTGEQWTGMHRIVEELCLLAIGNNLGVFPLPKDMWKMLPGSVPYFCVL